MGRDLKPIKDCTLCGSTSGKCKGNHDLSFVLCMSHTYKKIDCETDGYRYVGIDKSGQWGMYVLIDPNYKPRRKKESFPPLPEKPKDTATIQERDKSIRAMTRDLGLLSSHKELLLSRNLTQKDIEKYLYFSLDKGLNRVSDSVSLKFPSVQIAKYDNNKYGINRGDKVLYSPTRGIACVAFDYRGNAIGFQIRDEDPHADQKYKWVKDCHLINRELPITIIRPELEQQSNTAFICEGIGIKPQLASNLLDSVIISAPNCNLSGSPEQVKRTIEELGIESIIICPDGGDLINKAVRRRWSSQVKFLKRLGLRVSFLWWEQWHKEDKLDIDEITPERLATAQLLTPDEFFKIPTNKAAAKKNWRESKKFTPDNLINSQYFDYPIPQENSILAIKSPLGTGKTEYVLKMIYHLTDLLDDSNSERFIYPQYRNALNLNFVARVNEFFAEKLGKDATEIGDDYFKFINEYKSQDGISKLRDKSGKLPNIALCIDSFLLLNDEDFDGVNLICDEVISMLKHACFSGTLKDKRVKIIDKLEQALIRAKRIILLDGHLADWAVKYIGKLAKNKKIIRVENIFKKPNEQKDFIYLWEGEITEGDLNNPNKYSDLLKQIESNCENTNEGNIENIAIVSDSQKGIEALENLINKNYKNVKTLRVDSKTKGEEKLLEIYVNGKLQLCNEIDIFMSNPDNYILRNKINVLLMTPTCESGVDISMKKNEDYFYCEYGLFFGVLDVDSILQIIKRLRPKMPRYIYCKPFSTIKESFDYSGNLPELILKDIQKRQAKLIENCDFSGNINEDAIIKNLYQKLIDSSNKYDPLIADILSFRKYERANLRECLRERLMIDYVVIDSTSNYCEETMERYKGEKEAVIRQEAKWILESDTLPDNFDNSQKQERPFKKDNPTQLAPDQVSVKNWYYRNQLKGIESTEIWNEELIYEFLTNQKLISNLRKFYLFNNDEILENKLKSDILKKILNDYNSRLWSTDLPHHLRFIKALKKTSFDSILALSEYNSDTPEIVNFINEVKTKNLESELGFLGKMTNCQYVQLIASKIGIKQKFVRESRPKGQKKISFYKLIAPPDQDKRYQILLDCIARNLEKYLPESEKMIKFNQDLSKFICEHFNKESEINLTNDQTDNEVGENGLKVAPCKVCDPLPPPPVNVLNNIGVGWGDQLPSDLSNNESHKNLDLFIDNQGGAPVPKIEERAINNLCESLVYPERLDIFNLLDAIQKFIYGYNLNFDFDVFHWADQSPVELFNLCNHLESLAKA